MERDRGIGRTTVKCKTCGSEIEPAKFCPCCGEEQRLDAPSPGEERVPQHHVVTTGANDPVIGLGGIVAIVMITATGATLAILNAILPSLAASDRQLAVILATSLMACLYAIAIAIVVKRR
jgi:hypothetical protein